MGQWVSTGGLGNQSGSYPTGAGPGAFGFTSETGGADQLQAPHAVGPGTASCTGVITAKFTWDDAGDPSNVPPAVVIVEQDVSASWIGDPGGTCDTGFSDPIVPGTNGASTSGTHYYVINDPGQTITVTVSPSASTSLTAGSPTGLISGSATVTFQPTVIPVHLQFFGVVDPNTDKRLVVGQDLTASVVYDGEAPPSVDNQYSWTVSSLAMPFSEYYADDNSGTLIPFTPPNASAMYVKFAAGDASAHISCNVSLNDLGLQFTVQDDVGVVEPTYDVWTGPTLGRYWLLKGYSAYNTVQNPDFMKFLADPLVPNGLNAGIKVAARVVDPGAPFTGDPQGDGAWNYTQLLCPTTWGENPTPPGGYKYCQHYQEWGLDNVFPYLGPYSAALKPEYPWFADSPGYFGPFVKVHQEESFDVYLLYQPPGTVSSIVPVAKLEWEATGESNLDTNNYWIFSINTKSAGTFEDCHFHPEWTFRHINQTP